MPFNINQFKDVKDLNEDSDSSDGTTNPGTPKKVVHQGGNVTAIKLGSSGSTSPGASPSKNVNPSPKRTLFSRPSKMSITTAPRDVPAPTYSKDTTQIISPPSPLHYFAGHDAAQSAGSTNSSSTLSSLLKHAGSHVPHPHLHSGKSAATGTGNTNAATFSNGTRGRSFDMLRVPSSVPETTVSHAQQPISPSFFSSGARNVSAANQEYDDNWPLICARVLPLFNGEGLRQPIEDLNRLVTMHLQRVSERNEQVHVMEDLTELFETGIRSLDNNLAALPDEKLVSRLSEIWVFFFSTVLPYLEATFLPLTIELSNSPSLYCPPTVPAASNSLSADTSMSSGGGSNAGDKGSGKTSRRAEPITVPMLATRSYRDNLILPLQTRLSTIFSQAPLLLGQQEIFGRLLQCISVLRRVQSGDAKQRKCDELGSAVLFRRAKGRGDRRGIIGQKVGMQQDDDDAFVLGPQVDDEG